MGELKMERMGWRLNVALALLLATFVLQPSWSVAAENEAAVIPYQGQLADQEGRPINPSQTITLVFRVYSQPAGGTPSWQESHENVSVFGGRFSVLLGAREPFPDVGMFKRTVYLGVTVDDGNPATADVEMRPRQAIVPVIAASYATAAEHAERATEAQRATELVGPIPNQIVDRLNSLQDRISKLEEQARHVYVTERTDSAGNVRQRLHVINDGARRGVRIKAGANVHIRANKDVDIYGRRDVDIDGKRDVEIEARREVGLTARKGDVNIFAGRKDGIGGEVRIKAARKMRLLVGDERMLKIRTCSYELSAPSFGRYHYFNTRHESKVAVVFGANEEHCSTEIGRVKFGDRDSWHIIVDEEDTCRPHDLSVQVLFLDGWAVEPFNVVYDFGKGRVQQLVARKTICN